MALGKGQEVALGKGQEEEEEAEAKQILKPWDAAVLYEGMGDVCFHRETQSCKTSISAYMKGAVLLSAIIVKIDVEHL